ncbi:serpin family protein [Paenibacillus tepidiphilus]|uniref:serpin family protein n=1 Tax=Paenibacillus tepidiphilus TaxID=2608683 RepID=UPI001239D78E|nr:serpin family protein [Paenibacillus tepidiphilus]
MNLHLKRFALAALPLALLLTSCGSKGQAPDTPEVQAAEIQPVTGLGEQINRLGLELFGKLRQEQQGNLIISPYSIYSALALAYNGSAGETAEELGQLLGYKPGERSLMNQEHLALMEHLETTAEDIELKIANSVWVEQGLTLREPYRKQSDTYYSASIHTAELASEQAVTDINKWVSEQTKGRISRMLETPITPDPATVLLNALYFAAGWQQVFPEENTAAGDFAVDKATTVQAMMMQRSGMYMYAETEDWQAVRLPFSNSSMGMLILLPGKHSSVQELTERLSRGEIPPVEQMEGKTGSLTLPQFSASFDTDLKEAVRALGVKLAFDKRRGDFSELVKLKDPLYIDRILHKTFIHVDEKGTEGAASTLVGMLAGGAPPQDEPFEMQVNRPFIMAVEDWASGSWLFLGAIENPLDPS